MFQMKFKEETDPRALMNIGKSSLGRGNGGADGWPDELASVPATKTICSSRPAGWTPDIHQALNPVGRDRFRR